jgi:hypothetical protein
MQATGVLKGHAGSINLSHPLLQHGLPFSATRMHKGFLPFCRASQFVCTSLYYNLAEQFSE